MEQKMKTFFLILKLSLLVMASAVNLPIQAKTKATLGRVRTGNLNISASATAQNSYELRCRGGGLRFNSTPGRTLPTGEQMMNLTVNFSAGTQGANSGQDLNLKPGQCSWVDRGFRQGEPTQIRLEMVYFGQQKQMLKGSPVDRSATAAQSYPDAQNVPQYLSSSNRYWSFRVYNTNNGYLQATGNRYFKPAVRINPDDNIKTFPGARDRPSNVNKRE
jgi:hypothetical protein